MKRLVVSVVRVGDYVRTRYAVCLTCSTRDTQVLASTGCVSKHHLIGEHEDVLPAVEFRSKDV